MILIVLGIAPVMLGIALYSFVLGLRVWWRGRQEVDPSRRELKLLALHLFEPLISSLLVFVFALSGIPWSTSSLWTAWALSAPMLLMFIPIIYLRFWGSAPGSPSTRLLKLGLARWAVTFVMLVSVFYAVGFASVPFPSIPLVLCLLSIAILGYAVFIGRGAVHKATERVEHEFPRMLEA